MKKLAGFLAVIIALVLLRLFGSHLIGVLTGHPSAGIISATPAAAAMLREFHDDFAEAAEAKIHGPRWDRDVWRKGDDQTPRLYSNLSGDRRSLVWIFTRRSYQAGSDNPYCWDFYLSTSLTNAGADVDDMTRAKVMSNAFEKHQWPKVYDDKARDNQGRRIILYPHVYTTCIAAINDGGSVP